MPRDPLLHLFAMDKRSSLRQIPILSFLKENDLKTLTTGMTEAHYDKGQYISLARRRNT